MSITKLVRPQRVASLIAAVLIGFMALLVAPTQASAASNPCGSAYAQIKAYPMYNTSIRLVGYLRVYYSSASGKNCAVAWAAGPDLGVRRFRFVGIELSGTYNMDIDNGYYTTYAGPVYTPVSARGRCINLMAYFGTSPTAKYSRIDLNNVHCG